MGQAASPAPAPRAWDGDAEYLARCFARHRVCISFGLWICAASCWVAAHALLLYVRCAEKCGRDQSPPCAACRLLSSLCEAVGAVLARQLPIQVFTGAYLAAVDLVNFVFILFPVCGSRSQAPPGRVAGQRRRRRRLACTLALVLPLGLGPGWALWQAGPRAGAPVRGPGRALLGTLLQDDTEVLGYLLGGVAAVGSWASRIPQLRRICCGKLSPCIHLWAQLLEALAGLLYASALLAHDRRPEFLLRATPWLLTSLGRATLDLTVILLSCTLSAGQSCVRDEATAASGDPEDADTQALLPCTEREDGALGPGTAAQDLDWVPLLTLPRCKPLKTVAAISHCVELTLEPVQQVGADVTRLPGDGQTSAGDVVLQVTRSCVPASSSSEGFSSISSDLEWDPEDVSLDGNKAYVRTPRSRTHRGPGRPVGVASEEQPLPDPLLISPVPTPFPSSAACRPEEPVGQPLLVSPGMLGVLLSSYIVQAALDPVMISHVLRLQGVALRDRRAGSRDMSGPSTLRKLRIRQRAEKLKQENPRLTAWAVDWLTKTPSQNLYIT
ncbi:transmembrane protein 44 [Ctenodactylus gundi]